MKKAILRVFFKPLTIINRIKKKDEKLIFFYSNLGFRDNVKGKTITFVLSMEDEPGLLSVVLKKVAEFKANILTIHQTIPVNGIASLTLSVEILPTTGDASMMIEEIEQLNGVRYLKILSSDASL